MADAVTRVRMCLDVVASSPDGVTVMDVAHSLEMGRVSASRLLTMMVENSLVERDPVSRRFVMGLDSLGFASVALQRLNVLDVSFGPMAEASREHGLILTLGINKGPSTFFVQRVEKIRELVIASTPRPSKLPVHVSAAGKAILAFDRPEAREEALSSEMLAITKRSLSREALQQELEQIRERGFARNIGESRLEARAIAVPIFDRTGNSIAALAANSAPADYDAGFEDGTLPILSELALAVSRSCGFSRPLSL